MEQQQSNERLTEVLSQVAAAKHHYAALVESQTASEEARRPPAPPPTHSVSCQTESLIIADITNRNDTSCQTIMDSVELEMATRVAETRDIEIARLQAVNKEAASQLNAYTDKYKDCERSRIELQKENERLVVTLTRISEADTALRREMDMLNAIHERELSQSTARMMAELEQAKQERNAALEQGKTAMAALNTILSAMDERLSSSVQVSDQANKDIVSISAT